MRFGGKGVAGEYESKTAGWAAGRSEADTMPSYTGVEVEQRREIMRNWRLAGEHTIIHKGTTSRSRIRPVPGISTRYSIPNKLLHKYSDGLLGPTHPFRASSIKRRHTGDYPWEDNLQLAAMVTHSFKLYRGRHRHHQNRRHPVVPDQFPRLACCSPFIFG